MSVRHHDFGDVIPEEAFLFGEKMKLLILAVPDEFSAVKNLKTLNLTSNELTDDTLTPGAS